MSDPILREVQRGVGIITLNRPERRNAINRHLLTDLRTTLVDFDADPHVQAIVLTGSDPAFCAGMDLNELDGMIGDPDLIPWDAAMRSTAPWVPINTPVIGAINGPATTGGLELALACDFLIASERATFADTHARAGLIPGWGLTVRLALAVGSRRAREMSLTGRHLDAAHAYSEGLVQDVVPHAELLPSALAIAEEIAKVDERAVRAYLGVYRDVDNAVAGSGFHFEAIHMRNHLASLENHRVKNHAESMLAHGREQMGSPER